MSNIGCRSVVQGLGGVVAIFALLADILGPHRVVSRVAHLVLLPIEGLL